MQSLSNVLSKTNKYQPVVNKNNKSISYRTTDLVIVEAGDVANADPNYYKWYCLKAYQIGRERFLQLASIARNDGYDPKRLFTYLLNKEPLRKGHPTEGSDPSLAHSGCA